MSEHMSDTKNFELIAAACAVRRASMRTLTKRDFLTRRTPPLILRAISRRTCPRQVRSVFKARLSRLNCLAWA
jgi:hypothetical protein